MRQVTRKVVVSPRVLGGSDLQLLAHAQAVGHAANAVGLETGEPQRLGVLAFHELQRQDAHADEVAPVDALEALDDGSLDA